MASTVDSAGAALENTLFRRPVTHDGESWLDRHPPPRSMLLSSHAKGPALGFLPCGIVGLLSAAGGAGKTQALIQLAFAVATGLDWLGFSTVKPGNVAMVLGEEDDNELWRRLFASAEVLIEGIETKETAARLLGENLRISARHGLQCTIQDSRDPEALTGFGKDLYGELSRGSQSALNLIVIDPLSRFAGPLAEIDNHAATRFIEHLETLTKLPGNPTVIVAHHEAKGGRPSNQHSSRGASGLADAARWTARLGLDEGKPTLFHTKNSYGPLSVPLSLMRTQHGVLLVDDTSTATVAGSASAGVRSARIAAAARLAALEE